MKVSRDWILAMVIGAYALVIYSKKQNIEPKTKQKPIASQEIIID